MGQLVYVSPMGRGTAGSRQPHGLWHLTCFNIDSLQVYEKSIGTKMNDLDLCSEVVQGHVNHCVIIIAPKLLELETSNLVCGFVWGMPNGRTNNCP